MLHCGICTLSGFVEQYYVAFTSETRGEGYSPLQPEICLPPTFGLRISSSVDPIGFRRAI
jgi:hypothetical protein